jgi:Rod binding domain-containing protein
MDVRTSLQPTAMPGPMDIEGLSRAARGKDRAAVETAANGFEELFSQMLVKQMRQTLEPETMFGHDTGDVLGGLFDFYMGQHLAKGGGLGIGTILRQTWTPPTRS